MLHWPAEKLWERFDAAHEKSEATAVEALTEHLGPDQSPDVFWAKVEANIGAGRIRMLFVSARIPPELREVVEFLNIQMRPAEVLAVELRQYQGQELRTLAPIVLGRTQDAIEQKSSIAKPRRQWDEARVLQTIAVRSDFAVTETAKAIIDWMDASASRVLYTDSPTIGAVAAEIDVADNVIMVMRVWTDGTAAIIFNQLMRTSAFAADFARPELAERLNATSNVPIVKADTLEPQP